MRPIAYRLTGLLLALSCCPAFAQSTPTQVPLGGNAYITTVSPTGDELIDDNGLHNWDSTQAVISTYFDVQQAGQLDLSLIGHDFETKRAPNGVLETFLQQQDIGRAEAIVLITA